MVIKHANSWNCLSVAVFIVLMNNAKWCDNCLKEYQISVYFAILLLSNYTYCEFPYMENIIPSCDKN